jgi:hypothetical protein
MLATTTWLRLFLIPTLTTVPDAVSRLPTKTPVVEPYSTIFFASLGDDPLVDQTVYLEGFVLLRVSFHMYRTGVVRLRTAVRIGIRRF